MLESKISGCSDLAQTNRTIQSSRAMLFDQTSEKNRTLTSAGNKFIRVGL